MSKTSPQQEALFPPDSPAMRRTLPGLTPKRKLGSPGPEGRETDAREAALDNLDRYRVGLVEIAREIAVRLAQRRSRITSVEVFAEMRAQGYDEALDAVDPRWMGAVFREEIWFREGWETTGSHRRPVAIWSLRDPRAVPQSNRERVYRHVSASSAAGSTVEDIVVATGLSGKQVRACLKDLELFDKVLPSTKKPKRQRTYVLPEHHPDII